ncbi:hypothetical protein L195_g063870, partial [Trifolium pratense]
MWTRNLLVKALLVASICNVLLESIFRGDDFQERIFTCWYVARCYDKEVSNEGVLLLVTVTR